MRNSLPTMLLSGAMLASGCSSTDHTSVETKVESDAVKTRGLDRSLGERKPFTHDTLAGLELSDMTVELHGPGSSIGSSENVRLLIPAYHLDYRESTHINSDMHKQLFLQAEKLILEYDIRTVGVEVTPQIALLRDMLRESGLSVQDFLTNIQSIQMEMTGRPLRKDQMLFFEVALDDKLTVAERRSKLEPFIENPASIDVGLQDLLEAIYGDSPDLNFVSVDVPFDEYLNTNAFDDAVELELSNIANRVANIAIPIGDQVVYLSLANITDFAAIGDVDAQVFYCTYRADYLNAVGKWVQLIHTDRDPIVTKNIVDLNGPAIVVFGSYHTESLSDGVGQTIPVGVLKMRGSDPKMFKRQTAISRHTMLTPDLPELRDGLPACDTVLSK